MLDKWKLKYNRYLLHRLAKRGLWLQKLAIECHNISGTDITYKWVYDIERDKYTTESMVHPIRDSIFKEEKFKEYAMGKYIVEDIYDFLYTQRYWGEGILYHFKNDTIKEAIAKTEVPNLTKEFGSIWTNLKSILNKLYIVIYLEETWSNYSDTLRTADLIGELNMQLGFLYSKTFTPYRYAKVDPGIQKYQYEYMMDYLWIHYKVLNNIHNNWRQGHMFRGYTLITGQWKNLKIYLDPLRRTMNALSDYRAW